MFHLSNMPPGNTVMFDPLRWDTTFIWQPYTIPYGATALEIVAAGAGGNGGAGFSRAAGSAGGGGGGGGAGVTGGVGGIGSAGFVLVTAIFG